MMLDELSNRVAGELAERGLLGAATDARVSGERHLLQLLAIKALQAVDLPLAEIQQRLYGRSDAELKALVDMLAARAREHAASKAREAPLPALRLREIAVEPGVRLVVEEGWQSRDPDALEAKIRAALAAVGGER